MRIRALRLFVFAAALAWGCCVYAQPAQDSSPSAMHAYGHDAAFGQGARITPKLALAKARQALGMAGTMGGNASHPRLMKRARRHIHKARMAWKYAYAQEGDDLESDDPEYITASQLSQEALADARLALAQAHATRDRQRLDALKQMRHRRHQGEWHGH